MDGAIPTGDEERFFQSFYSTRGGMGVGYFFDVKGLVSRVSAKKQIWVFFPVFWCFCAFGGCFCVSRVSAGGGIGFFSEVE